MRDVLLSLLKQRKGFIDSLSESGCCGWTATQVRRDRHVNFDTFALRQNRVCRQFDLNRAIVNAECRNAVEENEGCELGASRGYFKPLAEQYGKQGLDMLFEHAQFEEGSVSVEAGLQDMLIRMESGRFKVFKHLNDWFDEFRLYHRKDGKVHKEGDDLMSATRYAVMMLRYARTAVEYNRFHRKIEYPKIGVV